MGRLQEEYILILILSGTLIILLLVAGMVLFILLYQKRVMKEKQLRAEQELAFQNQMIREKFASEESERKRIASDLHDSLGSLLWGAKVNAAFINRSLSMNEDIHKSFNDLNDVLDESIRVVRRIAWELTPEGFQYSGLLESVRKICTRLNGKGIELVLTEENGRLWNDDKALQMFRVVQEIISNALKHSGATILEIKMSWQHDEFEVNVRDNGIGLGVDVRDNGVGMWNIAQRVEKLHGKMHIGNPPIGTGLEINIKIPLDS
jgi:signal transduction histidine kinase